MKVKQNNTRNNNIKLKESSEKKNILYISGFRVSYYLRRDDNYNADNKIIKILNIFCAKKKIKLFLASSQIKNHLFGLGPLIEKIYL